MENKKGNQKNQLNKYVRFTSIALQMGLTIYLGSLLGTWIDSKTGNTDQLYFKVITLLAVFLAMFSVIRQVLNITNNDKND
ncbi:AtpZ/AtpI family protein [Tamlana haliotis]|uniref:AtpZ/AtpI family protein n=1 Tax=Pseudotamlana haliotis TaxID=2614804 RepID=A0A6N6M906_9FLAO|nr:AtpZ/AtpI family protein [Tamlana haliotis]KAB1066538.1 AtpZ/AtpI family protein [Tamlana haliotis]